MEVHHHSHHPKKWKEYLTEFFMLFAAVSLGFLAENIREGYVEKERAHELVSSFMKDVELNVHFVDSLLKGDKKSMLKCDSTALYIIKTPKDIDLEYVYEIPLHSFRYLSNNDTYDQMKSSGSLRYIKDPVLLEKILKYASDCAAAEARSSSMEADFVTGEYTNVLDKWMPNSSATKLMFNQRSGAAAVVNRESTSSLLIEEDEIKFLSPIISIKKDPTYNKEKSDEIRHAMLPTLSRRTALLINTVRFMGVAKESGLSLLEYIDKHEE